MNETRDGLPPRPIRPGDGDCCGNDCPLCVFTLYERELERWQAQVEAQLAQREAAVRNAG